jgi:carbohydrate diacid regulator
LVGLFTHERAKIFVDESVHAHRKTGMRTAPFSRVIPGQQQVAESVTRSVAEVLAAPAALVDESGAVIAESGADAGARRSQASVTFPVRLDGRQFRLVVGTSRYGEAVPERVRRTLIDLVVNQSAIAMRASQHDALKDRFIHRLLREPVQSEAEVLREAQILGMDLRRPRAVILLDASAYLFDEGVGGRSEERQRQRTNVVISAIVRYFQLPSDTICAHIGDGEVAVLKAIRRQDLGPWVEREGRVSLSKASWANLAAVKAACAGLLQRLRDETGATISIGVGRYHPRIRGLGRSYQDARAALHLGTRLFGAGQVYSLDQLGAAAFVGVTDERTRSDLATRLLSPLDGQHELLDTLAVFFDCDCSLSRTAKTLAIHRNTLGYRLDKVAALTDLDPRRFADAIQLRLAMLVRSLGGEASLSHMHDIGLSSRAALRSTAQTRG